MIRISRSALYLLFFLTSISAFAQMVNRSSLSLKDAYNAALKKSETVGIQQELVIQANEVERQAIGALFPTINGVGTFLKQETPSGATGNTISPATQNTVKITGDQPLFRGFRDFAFLKQKSNLTTAQSYALQNAAKQLFYDLSAAYYNVLILKKDEMNYLDEIQVNRNRLKELQGFLRIGRSRKTELLIFQSNISTLEAQLESTRTQLESAKEVLSYLTGWDRNVNLEDSEPPPVFNKDVGSFLAQIEKRPDIQTAAAQAKSFEESIPIARGGHLPSVDLLGNYYFDRPGIVSNVNWDVQLAVTLPLFQGGVIQSEVRQAASVSRQYNLLLSQARRLAEQEIRTFYDSLNGNKRQFDKLTESFDWSKKNYEAELKDYRNGLVTNLEVLQAITTYQGAQRLMDRQHYLIKLDSVKLQAATAARPEINIRIDL